MSEYDDCEESLYRQIKGYQKRITELEAENESLSERARQWDMHNCTTHAMKLAQENASLKEQLQEQAKLLDYYRIKSNG